MTPILPPRRPEGNRTAAQDREALWVLWAIVGLCMALLLFAACLIETGHSPEARDTVLLMLPVLVTLQALQGYAASRREEERFDELYDLVARTVPREPPTDQGDVNLPR